MIDGFDREVSIYIVNADLEHASAVMIGEPTEEVRGTIDSGQYLSAFPGSIPHCNGACADESRGLPEDLVVVPAEALVLEIEIEDGLGIVLTDESLLISAPVESIIVESIR